MKIAHLHNIRWWNAVSHYAYDLIRALKALGHEQLVITGKNNPINRYLKDLEIETLQILPDKDIQYLPLYLKKLPIEDASVIFTYWGRDQQLALKKRSPWQKLLRIRMDARKPSSNLAAKKIFKRTDAIIFPSLLEKQRFAEHNGSDFQFHILKGSVDTCSGDHSAPFHSPIRILHVARTSPVKGHSTFLQALSILGTEGVDFKTRFIGNEAEIPLSRLKAMALELNISERCEFLGFVPCTDAHFNWADMGIISSNGSEVYSRALYEYISHNIPVAATSVGIIPEIRSEVDFGEVLSAEDPGGFADGIKKTIKRFTEIKAAEKQYCNKVLEFQNFKERLSELLKSL